MIDNESNSFGKPWKYRYDLINKDISNDWREELTPPESLTYFQAVKIKNKIHIIGGHNTKEILSGIDLYEFNKNIYSCEINKDGTLTEWKSEIPLPITKNIGQSLLIKNKLYLIGGYNKSNIDDNYYNNDILIGTIDDKGNIKKWNRSLSLCNELYGTQAINIKDKIILISGIYNVKIAAQPLVLFLNKNGMIKNYYFYKKYLPKMVIYPQLIIFKDKIHLLGGHIPIENELKEINFQFFNFIQSSNIDDNGDINHWNHKDFLPTALANFQAIIIGNKVFILGGIDIFDHIHTTIYMSTINEDGTLNEFIKYSYLPELIYGIKPIITDNRLYIIGNIIKNDEILNKIYSVSII